MQTKQINITSWTNAWTATKRGISPDGDSSWFHISDNSGSASLLPQVINVSVDDNNTRYNKQGAIDFNNSEKIVTTLINQFTDNPIIPNSITVNPYQWINVPSSGATKSDFTVSMTGDPVLMYDIQSKPSWITVNTAILVPGSLSITVTNNEDYYTTAQRTGTIILEHSQEHSETATITVIQEGKLGNRRNNTINVNYNYSFASGHVVSATAEMQVTSNVNIQGSVSFNNGAFSEMFNLTIISGNLSALINYPNLEGVEINHANTIIGIIYPQNDDFFNYNAVGHEWIEPLSAPEALEDELTE